VLLAWTKLEKGKRVKGGLEEKKIEDFQGCHVLQEMNHEGTSVKEQQHVEGTPRITLHPAKSCIRGEQRGSFRRLSWGGGHR